MGIKRAFACFDRKGLKAPREDEELTLGIVVVPFYQSMMDRSAKVLHRRNICPEWNNTYIKLKMPYAWKILGYIKSPVNVEPAVSDQLGG